MHIRKPHSKCSSDGIPKIIMSRHVLIALPEAFNGWAYWTHYEKKMNMSQDEKKMNMSDGSTSEASSWDMTQDELDEMNRATRLPLPTPGVDKKLDSGVDKGLTSCSESPTSSSMSSSPNGKQESSLLSAEFPHLAPHVDGYHTFVQQMGGLESRHFEHWKQIDTRFTEKACILRGSLMAKIATDIPVTTPRVKRATAVAARKLMCVRVMEACVHICMYVCMYVWTYVCMSVSIHVCMYVCTLMAEHYPWS